MSVWAELSAAMSAALLRRGLELLGAPDGEEGLARDVQRARRGGGGGGLDPRGYGTIPAGRDPGGMETLRALRPRAVPLPLPCSPPGRARPGQAERGSGEADPESEGYPSPETAELGQGQGAQVGDW